jgi:branched-chain amino acid transport system permease protein
VGVAELLQFVVSGLKNGAIYALIALGFSLVYSATGVINFAQGEFYMLGGMVAVWLLRALGLPLLLAVPLAVVVTVGVGALVERLALRPRRFEPPLVLIIITIGVSMVLQSLARHLFGPDEVALPAFTAGPSVIVLGAAIERQTLWVWGLTAVALLVLWLIYTKTKLGLAMRATAVSHDASRLVGVDTARVVMVVFALAAALGALAGVAVAPLTQTAYDVGSRIGVKGFTAAILGGLGGPVAAVVGGLVLGLVESLSVAFISSTYKDAIALVLLLAVLILKPSGLLSRSSREKV